MSEFSILSDEFAEAAAAATRRARQDSLAAGHPVVFRDSFGRYVQELPDGRLFEVRFNPGKTGAEHLEVLGEVQPAPAVQCPVSR